MPIIICLLIILPRFYFKKVKPLDKVKRSKIKEKFSDFFSILLMLICSTGIFFGIAFSLIITTNKFFGKSENVMISQPIEKYTEDITKNGRLRHYIEFKNPKTNKIIILEVYKKYKVGDVFQKEMKYGAWEILYSTE